jgi:hypothetical protein
VRSIIGSLIFGRGQLAEVPAGAVNRGDGQQSASGLGYAGAAVDA